ncbi:hypothetical protein MMC21_004621 [Puttea exsequens]|nr:hypothetical protein [Puttea exsequens]
MGCKTVDAASKAVVEFIVDVCLCLNLMGRIRGFRLLALNVQTFMAIPCGNIQMKGEEVILITRAYAARSLSVVLKDAAALVMAVVSFANAIHLLARTLLHKPVSSIGSEPPERISITQTPTLASGCATGQGTSTGHPDTSGLVYITGPLPDPVIPTTLLLPAPTTSGLGGGIPIIPIIPIPPPPPGFPPPPPGMGNPKEQCPAGPAGTKCGDCEGVDGWCINPPGCPCQEACTENEYKPDCSNEDYEGNGQSSCYTVYPSTPVPSTTERIATTKKPSPTITLTTKRPKNHPDVQFTSEGSVAIWYFVDTGCYGDPTICSQTFNVYSVTKGKDPSDVCSGWDGSANYHHPNIDFELPQLPGGSVDFIYSRSGEHDPGFVKGDGIPSSVSCSAAPSPTASQECAYEIDTNFGDKVKRVGGPPPPAVRVAYEGYHWSSCDWGLGELPPGR